MKPPEELTLHGMIYPGQGEWVGHCLELDIVATGKDANGAIDQLVEAVETQVWYARTHDNLEHLFCPAPTEAWKKFAQLVKGPHEVVVRSIDGADDPKFRLQSLLAG